MARTSSSNGKYLNLSFSIEGEQQVSRAFDFIGKEISNFSKPLMSAQEFLIKTWKENMQDEGKTLAGGWAPLSPAYASAKLKKYGNKRILERTGLMGKSFSGLVNSTSLTLWNSASYFAYHQSNKTRTRLPRRMMMKIDDTRRKEVQRFFTEYLDEVRGHFTKGK
ncbi:MAG: hypothetical protein WCJ84_00440 [Candidatus Peregrinibacteria bacterium]